MGLMDGRSRRVRLRAVWWLAPLAGAVLAGPARAETNTVPIRADLYNIERLKIAGMGGDGKTYSHRYAPHLDVYGPLDPEFGAVVSVRVLNAGGNPLFNAEKQVGGLLSRRDPTVVIRRERDFRVSFMLPKPLEEARRVGISIEHGDRTLERSLEVRQHRLYGRVTDFEGEPLADRQVLISADAHEETAGTLTDAEGRYAITLPGRTYNKVWIDDERQTGQKSLQFWAWNVILDRDTELDARVGRIQVYELNTWNNNAGGDQLFAYFRPMALSKSLMNPMKTSRLRKVGERTIRITDLSPHFDSQGIEAHLNGQRVPVFTAVQVLEAIAEDWYMPSYVAQISRRNVQPGRNSLRLVINAETPVDSTTTVTERGEGVIHWRANFEGFGF